MSSKFSADPHSPEVKTLFTITRLRLHTHLQDYFHGVMTTLSECFPVGYSALILYDSKRDSLCVEGVYGVGMDIHPRGTDGRKGLIANVLSSRQPMVLHDLGEEPLYDEAIKGGKRLEKIRPPLVCCPLMADDEPIGVINITSLYGPKNEFIDDFQFLSVLSALLSPAIKNYHLKKNEGLQKGRGKTKSSFLDEILEEKLSEVLNRIDPDLESKARMSIFDDIVAVVEKILIKSALERMGHVQTAAAQFLGINRNTLRKKMKEMKIKGR